MAAYQHGDVMAFDQLVTRHERPLWIFLRRFVADAATAEDLLQEVFLRVVNAAADWKSEAKFSTWLYTIARNLCTDHARRAVHRKALSLDSQPAGAGAGAAGDEDSGKVLADGIAAGAERGQGEAAAMNSQLAAHIDRAVNALPSDQREVFLLREVMDMPFLDIARAVGASEPTVKSRMRYALEKLRGALGEFQGSGR